MFRVFYKAYHGWAGKIFSKYILLKESKTIFQIGVENAVFHKRAISMVTRVRIGVENTVFHKRAISMVTRVRNGSTMFGSGENFKIKVLRWLENTIFEIGFCKYSIS